MTGGPDVIADKPGLKPKEPFFNMYGGFCRLSVIFHCNGDDSFKGEQESKPPLDWSGDLVHCINDPQRHNSFNVNYNSLFIYMEIKSVDETGMTIQFNP